jgi:hypothetical protein
MEHQLTVDINLADILQDHPIYVSSGEAATSVSLTKELKMRVLQYIHFYDTK